MRRFAPDATERRVEQKCVRCGDKFDPTEKKLGGTTLCRPCDVEIDKMELSLLNR